MSMVHAGETGHGCKLVQDEALTPFDKAKDSGWWWLDQPRLGFSSRSTASSVKVKEQGLRHLMYATTEVSEGSWDFLPRFHPMSSI